VCSGQRRAKWRTRHVRGDRAVQVALLSNRRLQASLQRLGIAEADLVQAGWMSNPSISFSRRSNGHEVEVERAVVFDIIGLLTIPLRGRIESERFEMAKVQAASDAVRLAADTQRAYFNAVAAQQSALYADQVRSSAEASAQLASRMAQVGNFSKLDQAREQAFYADATVQVARARHQAAAAREQLARLMGLWGNPASSFTLPDRLPELPASLHRGDDIEAQALRQRLDIALAKQEAAATARGLGLSKATRLVNVLHAGYANTSASGEPRALGSAGSLFRISHDVRPRKALPGSSGPAAQENL
jgi:outer membrane protein TolC